MSYRIDYQGPKKLRGAERKTAGFPALTGLCLLGFLIFTALFWPRGAAALRALLIPGDEAVTVGALEELARALGAGEAGAFRHFCQAVMGVA